MLEVCAATCTCPLDSSFVLGNDDTPLDWESPEDVEYFKKCKAGLIEYVRPSITSFVF